MKTLTMYEHRCKRCEKTFISKSKTPMRCGKCKTPYWNRERQIVKAQA